MKVVLIPAKNEEEGVKEVIKESKKYADKVILIDGDSKDNTVKVGKRLGVEVFEGDGEGKGRDFSKFLSEHKINSEDFYVMLDGDGTYLPRDIPKFFEALKRYEIVSGKRKGVPFKLKNIVHFIGNKIISLTGFLLYGKYMDICTGMWGFRGKTLKKLKISAKGFELEADLFINLNKLGLKHKQIWISCEKRIGKEKLKEIDGFKIIYFLFKKRFTKN